MMDFGLSEILLLLVTGVLFLLWRHGKEKRNLPPGPNGPPIVGNIFQLASDGHLKMSEWARKYGKIYKLQLGNKTTIVINDIKLLREAFGDSNFASRPHSEVIELMTGGPYGKYHSHKWSHVGRTRPWSLRKLREFGFGKASMEGLIMDEVNEMIEIFEKNGESPMLVTETVSLAVLNSLWTIMNGERLRQDNPQIKDILETNHTVVDVITKSGLFFVPWLKYVFPRAQKKIEEGAERLLTFSRQAIVQHWDTYEDGVSRDFIDEYIGEIKRTTDETSSFYGDLGRKNLEGVVGNLIQAGSETTSSTLVWVLNFVTEYPEVQEKIQREIEMSVGSSRQVGLSDKLSLPYTEATIQETLRYSYYLPTGVQRSALEDAEVGGYTIPKDALVLPNLYYIHHDPAIWGDPEKFRPERFLSPDGKKVMKHEALIPFQVGKRQCLGETLARDTLFLVTANLLQHFQVERLEKEFPVALSGVVLLSKPFHFIFKSRRTSKRG